jgi:hypothetical protein
MVTRLRTRAVEEEAEIREVVHRALLAYLATPLSTSETR